MKHQKKIHVSHIFLFKASKYKATSFWNQTGVHFWYIYIYIYIYIYHVIYVIYVVCYHIIAPPHFDLDNGF